MLSTDSSRFTPRAARGHKVTAAQPHDRKCSSRMLMRTRATSTAKKRYSRSRDVQKTRSVWSLSSSRPTPTHHVALHLTATRSGASSHMMKVRVQSLVDTSYVSSNGAHGMVACTLLRRGHVRRTWQRADCYSEQANPGQSTTTMFMHSGRGRSRTARRRAAPAQATRPGRRPAMRRLPLRMPTPASCR